MSSTSLSSSSAAGVLSTASHYTYIVVAIFGSIYQLYDPLYGWDCMYPSSTIYSSLMTSGGGDDGGGASSKSSSGEFSVNVHLSTDDFAFEVNTPPPPPPYYNDHYIEWFVRLFYTNYLGFIIMCLLMQMNNGGRPTPTISSMLMIVLINSVSVYWNQIWYKTLPFHPGHDIEECFYNDIIPVDVVFVVWPTITLVIKLIDRIYCNTRITSSSDETTRQGYHSSSYGGVAAAFNNENQPLIQLKQ